MVAPDAERVDDLERLALELFDLRRLGAHMRRSSSACLFDVDAAERFFDRFGAHLGREDITMLHHAAAIPPSSVSSSLSSRTVARSARVIVTYDSK